MKIAMIVYGEVEPVHCMLPEGAEVGDAIERLVEDVLPTTHSSAADPGWAWKIDWGGVTVREVIE